MLEPSGPGSNRAGQQRKADPPGQASGPSSIRGINTARFGASQTCPYAPERQQPSRRSPPVGYCGWFAQLFILGSPGTSPPGMRGEFEPYQATNALAETSSSPAPPSKFRAGRPGAICAHRRSALNATPRTSLSRGAASAEGAYWIGGARGTWAVQVPLQARVRRWCNLTFLGPGYHRQRKAAASGFRTFAECPRTAQRVKAADSRSYKSQTSSHNNDKLASHDYADLILSAGLVACLPPR